MPRLLVLNGPNLGLLGSREPDVYGTDTLADVEAHCRDWAGEVGWQAVTHQSNHEGDLIDRIHERDVDGIVFNPGALTHTSYALHDAITGVGTATVETHISNVMEREPWRRRSVIRPACVHAIYGRGIDGYRWAIRHLAHRAEWPVQCVAYGPEPDQFLDVRRPDTDGPHDAVVIFHGGFWRHQWTRDTTEGIAVDLTRRGWLTANVEYRRVGAGGGWPESVDDAVAAVARVASMSSVRSVVVIGHSAGGHLAVHAAGPNRAPVVGLGSVLDLALGLEEGTGGTAIENFLDGADPSVATAISVASDRPRVLLHGVDDAAVPVGQSRSFVIRHPETRLVELAGTGHFEFLERSSPAWEAVLDELTRLRRT